IPQSQESMNLGFGYEDQNKGTYPHEFGHAIGCIHEHQRIPPEYWDKDAVYRALSGPPNNWTRDQIDHNMFDYYGEDRVNGSRLDPSSLMWYFMPPSWFKKLPEGYRNRPNEVWSDTDKSFLASMY